MTGSGSSNAATLRLAVIPSDRLEVRDRAAIVRLCSEAFQCDYAPFLDAFGDSTHVIGYLDREIVSHALWLSRPLRVGEGAPADAAYVEAVATRADHQRRGYGAAIMREVQSRISDHDFGALSTSVPAWYESLGWKRWLGSLFVERRGKVTRTVDECVMVYEVPGRPLPDITAPLTAGWRPLESW